MSSRVDDFKCRVVTAIILGSVLFSYGFLIAIGFGFGFGKGYKEGYISALDDIRLGKPVKYKLVQTAEKWVEVEK